MTVMGFAFVLLSGGKIIMGCSKRKKIIMGLKTLKCNSSTAQLSSFRCQSVSACP